MKRRDQVVICRLRMITSKDNIECSFCNDRLTVEHNLWDCKETEAERQRANIQNNIWNKGRDGMKQLVEYVKKKTGFFQGI
jgi:hypothetical protein